MIYLTLFTVINNTFKKLLKTSKQINLAFMIKKKKNCVKFYHEMICQMKMKHTHSIWQCSTE